MCWLDGEEEEEEEEEDDEVGGGDGCLLLLVVFIFYYLSPTSRHVSWEQTQAGVTVVGRCVPVAVLH